MTRLPPRAPPHDPAIADELTKLMPPGVPPLRLFLTLAHNPRVLRRVRLGGLLDPGSITLREREIVILRTCALCRSEYEWGVHVALFAGAAGLGAPEIAATVSGDRTAFPAAERLLLALCDELHRGATIGDELWRELAAVFQPAQLVELIALAGQYHMISYATNALGIELEAFAPRFPISE